MPDNTWNRGDFTCIKPEYLKSERNMEELSRIISRNCTPGMPKLLGIFLLRDSNKVSSVCPSYENTTYYIAMEVFDQWLIDHTDRANYATLHDALAAVEFNHIRHQLPDCQRDEMVERSIFSSHVATQLRPQDLNPLAIELINDYTKLENIKEAVRIRMTINRPTGAQAQADAILHCWTNFPPEGDTADNLVDAVRHLDRHAIFRDLCQFLTGVKRGILSCESGSHQL